MIRLRNIWSRISALHSIEGHRAGLRNRDAVVDRRGHIFPRWIIQIRFPLDQEFSSAARPTQRNRRVGLASDAERDIVPP